MRSQEKLKSISYEVVALTNKADVLSRAAKVFLAHFSALTRPVAAREDCKALSLASATPTRK
jgi:hypothetical protein